MSRGSPGARVVVIVAPSPLEQVLLQLDGLAAVRLENRRDESSSSSLWVSLGLEALWVVTLWVAPLFSVPLVDAGPQSACAAAGVIRLSAGAAILYLAAG